MKKSRATLVLGLLHVFLFISMVWASYAAEMKWQVIGKGAVELGFLVRPIQYLAFSPVLFGVFLAIFAGLLVLLWRTGRPGALALIATDVLFVLLMLQFAFQLMLLELPLLPWDQRIDYIIRTIRG